MSKPYYITTAIVYTSGKPHIGNLVDPILADVLARFQRLRGRDVYYLTGTDEHGVKVQEKAQAEGIEPQELVDRLAAEVKRQWDLMNTDYNHFSVCADVMCITSRELMNTALKFRKRHKLKA